MIRVFIADDHDIVRSGIKRLVDEFADLTVCGEADDAFSLSELTREAAADVLVLDVNMPGVSGPGTVREIVSLPGTPKVVVFTMYNEDSHAVGFLRAGASAFINKRRSSDELIRAIRKAAEGRRYITPELAEFLFENQIDIQKEPARILSDRELQVVRGLADGQRATEIASELGVSVSTVNTFVQRTKEKLGARTVVEIVQFANDNGLLG